MPVQALTVHSHTPTLVVTGQSGLTLRSVGYCRSTLAEPVEARINHTTYDPAGRAIELRDPRLVSDASAPANLITIYSLSGKVLCTISVDVGLRVSLFGEADQPVQGWDGCGSQRWTEYDDQLRPLTVFEQAVEDEPLCSERYGYGGADPTAAAYNQCGQLIRHDDPAGRLLFAEFGVSGGLLEQTRDFLRELEPPDWPELVADREKLLESVAGATTRSRFNALGEAFEQTDAKGNRQFFSQTVAGQLREVRLQLAKDSAPTPLVSAIQYNAHGQTEREFAGNGVLTTLDYDREDGRLIRLQAIRGNATLQDLRYAYDPAGNVLSIEDAALPIRFFANQCIEPISWYDYDSLYQLIAATGWEAGAANRGPQFSTFDDPAAVGHYRQTYRYDAGNNLLELTHVGPQNHGHRLVAAAHSNRCLPVLEGVEPGEEDFRHGFDGNGNLLNLQPGQSLSWDLRNQLREVRPVERDLGDDDSECYVYGSDGMRVRKVRSTHTHARTLIVEVRYLLGLELRSHSGTGEVLQVISVQAGRSSVRVLHWEPALPKDSANDQYRYSLNDYLGSCTLELDGAGEVISQERYHPFGTTAWCAGRGESYKTVRYSGKERDATGLYYYGFRYYISWWQRWLNPDPAGAVDGLNLYRIVRNNPVNLKDVDGRQSNFKDLFKPEQGDLIFGLANVLDKGYLSWWAVLSKRGDYLAKYLEGNEIAKLEEGLNSKRDSYSSIRGATRLMGLYSQAGAKVDSSKQFWAGQYSSIATLVFRMEEQYYANIKARYGGWRSTSANRQFSESYAAELANGHYSVRKTFEKYVDADDKFGHKLISRASKAGLSTILSSGRTDVIHFTLDDLDMDQVVMKTRRSATSSELRYLFRNREKLVDKVLFYQNNKLVDAPWRTDRTGWSRYKPKSTLGGASSSN